MTTLLKNISGRLSITLSKPPERIAPNLANERATDLARIVELVLKAEVYVEEAEDFRPLTHAELAAVVFREPSIRLAGCLDGQEDAVVEHKAPNGSYFTRADLVAAIEETERRTWPNTAWFGGIDVHHVYFEGLERRPDGVWCILWGS